MPSLWVRGEDGQLVPLEATSYAAEADLQVLLAEHPELLAGDLLDPDRPRRWLLVQRELQIAFDSPEDSTRWSLDHLFLDQDGVPTLVEVKRSSDARVHREVVAQMLDYAASFRVNWPMEQLRSTWEATCDQRGVQPGDDLVTLLEDTGLEPDQFWSAVATNIAANKLRLLFVGDRLPARLVRIIEYLNEEMANTEVLGIEIVPHSTGAPDEPMTAYAADLRGRTAAVAQRKQPSERRTRAEFDAMVRTRHGEQAVAAVARLVTSAEALGGWPTIGTDTRNPQLFLNFDTALPRRPIWPIAIGSRPGKVMVQLRWLKNHPAFADDETRVELLGRISEAVGHPVEGRLDGFPGFHVNELDKPGVVDALIAVLAWARDRARKTGP